jgi:hypothetical protein
LQADFGAGRATKFFNNNINSKQSSNNNNTNNNKSGSNSKKMTILDQDAVNLRKAALTRQVAKNPRMPLPPARPTWIKRKAAPAQWQLLLLLLLL